MIFSIITIFPDFFNSPLKHGLLEKAIAGEKVRVNIYNLREYAKGRHRQTDDAPFGGGPGMVMMPAPLSKAITKAKKDSPNAKVFALSPGGRVLNDRIAREIAENEKKIILVCGRYEGMDQRIIDHYCHGELSIGDFVLTGGEAAALVVMDAVSRHIPGVIGDPESVSRESFAKALAYPQYTRPANFEGHKAPDVLTSGHKKNIEKWRDEAALLRTKIHRPDLLINLCAEKLWTCLNLPSELSPGKLKRAIRTVEILLTINDAHNLGGVVICCPNKEIRDKFRDKFDSGLVYIKSGALAAVRTVLKRTGKEPKILEPGFSHTKKELNIKAGRKFLTDQEAPVFVVLSEWGSKFNLPPGSKTKMVHYFLPKSIEDLPLPYRTAIILDRLIGN